VGDGDGAIREVFGRHRLALALLAIVSARGGSHLVEKGRRATDVEAWGALDVTCGCDQAEVFADQDVGDLVLDLGGGPDGVDRSCRQRRSDDRGSKSCNCGEDGSPHYDEVVSVEDGDLSGSEKETLVTIVIVGVWRGGVYETKAVILGSHQRLYILLPSISRRQ